MIKLNEVPVISIHWSRKKLTARPFGSASNNEYDSRSPADYVLLFDFLESICISLQHSIGGGKYNMCLA
jgi:hypothetical protein